MFRRKNRIVDFYLARNSILNFTQVNNHAFLLTRKTKYLHSHAMNATEDEAEKYFKQFGCVKGL
jgi:hypothetical protein